MSASSYSLHQYFQGVRTAQDNYDNGNFHKLPSLDFLQGAQKFFKDDVTYLANPLSGFTSSGRVSKPPERFSDLQFTKGSGAAPVAGFDETDMDYEG